MAGVHPPGSSAEAACCIFVYCVLHLLADPETRHAVAPLLIHSVSICVLIVSIVRVEHHKHDFYSLQFQPPTLNNTNNSVCQI